jgi:hypothetical protein
VSNDAIERAEALFLRARPESREEEYARTIANMHRLKQLRLAKEAEEGPPKKRHRI